MTLISLCRLRKRWTLCVGNLMATADHHEMTSKTGCFGKAAVTQRLMENIWPNRQSSMRPPLMRRLSPQPSARGCGVSGLGEGREEEELGEDGWREGWREGGTERGRREGVEYLLGLLQGRLQPADFLLVLLPHLVHLLIVSGHLLLQGSLQSRQLSLAPPQHLLLLLPGQENFLQLQLQLHHVLWRRVSDRWPTSTQTQVEFLSVAMTLDTVVKATSHCTTRTNI